ncbi:hypothetical protein QYF36_010962 [Acer negundo]|nr:hypothetical protein QYF36_010962 [Acer negundo]
MSNETEDAAQVSSVQAAEAEAAHFISTDVDLQIAGEDDKEMTPLNDAVRSFPFDVVKDLSSKEVCMRCIFRLFGVQVPDFSLSQPSILNNFLGEQTDSVKQLEDTEPKSCSICLGVLQFAYCDDKERSVKKESANDLAVTIADLVKKEGYQIDSFSLEVSLPPIISENENMAWSYVKNKYGSELRFQERSLSNRIYAKEALKSALANPLETLLFCRMSSVSSFRIRLTYTHAKATKTVQNFIERNEGCKRRKVGTENGLDSVKDGSVSTSEANTITQRSSDGLLDNNSSEVYDLPLEKVNEPCRLECLFNRTPIYFGGRYLKYSRNVSQTRWIIDDERMGEASIEEIIAGNILPICRGDNYKFHAAGREDIDVRMLGSGRPFLVEIQNAHQVPSELFVKEIETKINNLENRLIRVKNLKVVGSEGWTLMREGESEKQKQYTALVWISRSLQDEDLQSISSIKEMQILQRTPIRVLHRRSPLDREKIIHWINIEKIAGSSQYFLLHLCTQAGTYIKEFVHGDLGRTNPSIGSILGCRAEILQLDVTEVKMDCFLDE